MDDERGSYDVDFKWSSFTVNNSWQAERHRDQNNVGENAIVTVGSHIGGEVRRWPTDSRKSPASNPKDEDRMMGHPPQSSHVLQW